MPIPLIVWGIGAAVAAFFAEGCSGEKGPQGPKGDKGDPGTNGKNGSNGKDGLPGKDGKNGTSCTVNGAYVKCEDGTSAYVMGPTGPKGDNGEPGVNGKDGAPGKNGQNGINGKDGSPGPKGDPGDPACVDPTVVECTSKNGTKLKAVGDGKNNDQPALQCTLDAVSAKGGGTVCLPKGVFRLDNRLSLIGTGITLSGQGALRTVLVKGDIPADPKDGNNVIRVDGKKEIGGPTYYFAVQNLGIVGSEDFHLLAITNSAGVGEINQVSFMGAAAAAVFLDVCGGVTLRKVTIGNNDFLPPQFSNSGAPTVGIKIGSETRNIFLESPSITGAGTGIQIIDLDPGSSSAPQGISILGADIRTPNLAGGGVGISIEGSYYKDPQTNKVICRTSGPVNILGATIIQKLAGGVAENDLAINMVRANSVGIAPGIAMSGKVRIVHSTNIVVQGLAMYGLIVDPGVTGAPCEPHSMGVRILGGSIVSIKGTGGKYINDTTKSSAINYSEWGLWDM